MPDGTNIQFFPGDIVTHLSETPEGNKELSTGIIDEIKPHAVFLKTDTGPAMCMAGEDGAPPVFILRQRGLEGSIRDMSKDQFKAALIDVDKRITEAQKLHRQRCHMRGISLSL